MSVSPAHCTLLSVQTGLPMAAIPHSLTLCGTMYCSPACSGYPVWPKPSDRTRKDNVPLCHTPWGLEPSVTPLPINEWGISPFVPTLPWLEWSIAITGQNLWDSFPVLLAVPLQLSAQGQATGTSVGRKGLTGVAGGSTDPFQDSDGSSLSPVSPCHLLLPSHWLTSYVFLLVIPRKPYWMCGLGIELTHVHFTSKHTLSLTNAHSPYTDILSSLQALLSKPTHRIVSGTALPCRLCVGGTEPQALSVSIAHVKSHVGCNEPPTIPGTIT